MSQLNVNPEKVDQLIKRLHQHTIELDQKQKSMKSHLTQLQTSWNDVHYQTFVQQFDEFDKLIKNAIRQSETILLPNLTQVKKLAEDYKNMGRK